MLLAVIFLPFRAVVVIDGVISDRVQHIDERFD
jgi:hypothetical protein